MLLRHSVRYSLSLGYNWNGLMQTLGVVGGGLGCLPPWNSAPPLPPLPLSLLVLGMLAMNTHLLCQVRCGTIEVLLVIKSLKVLECYSTLIECNLIEIYAQLNFLIDFLNAQRV